MTSNARGEPGELLEREVEVARVDMLLSNTVAGRGGVLVFEGPAGIGKTSLLQEAATSARQRTMTVARARGRTLEQDFAFGAVRQLLEPLVAAVDDPDALFTGAAAASRSIFGQSGGSETATATSDPGVVLHGLYWLVATLAESNSLLLVCDDVHWFDGPSLRLVAYLANRVDDLPVAILVGTRPPEPGPDVALLARLLSSHAQDNLAPAALSQSAVALLVRSAFQGSGGVVDDNFCAAVAEASRGNPFFVGEVVRTARAAGISPNGDAVAELVQVSASTSILDRIGRLSGEALTVARATAVLGADAHLRHVASLAGLTVDEAGAAADTLLRAEILTADRPLAFEHPIVAAAVYQTLLPGERSALHRQAADLLVKEAAPPDRVATHLLATDCAGSPEVVEILGAAAHAAMAHGATDSAIACLRRALDEPPTPDRRLGVLFELGAAEALVTDPGAIDHLGEVIAGIDDPETQIMLATVRGISLRMVDRAEDALAGLDHLIPTVADDPTLRLRLLSSTVLVGLMGQSSAALVANRVTQLRRAIGSADDAEPGVLGVRAYVGAFANEPADEVAAMAMRSLRNLRQDDPTLPIWFHLPVVALITADRDADAAVIVEEGLALARLLGAPAHLGVTLFLRAWLALRAGELDDAETDARAALETLTLHGVRFVIPGPVAILVDVLRERNEIATADAVLEEFGLSTGVEDSLFHLFLLSARGRLRSAQDREAEAFADFELGFARTRDFGCECPGFIPWLSYLVLSDIVQHRAPTERTREWANQAHEFGESFGSPRARAEGLRALSWADPSSPDEISLEAIRLFAECGDPIEEGRLLIGLELTRRGKIPRAESRRMLTRALDLAERSGSVRLQAVAHRYLTEIGAVPDRRSQTGAASLTPSERRVAALAADGLTNKSIAQELFVSVKTVETHLAHVFQKLAIASRADLIVALSPAAISPPRSG